MKNVYVELSSPDRWFAAVQNSLRRVALASTIVLAAVATSATWAGDSVVNINTATAEVLAEGLSGVGLAKAHRIVEHREAYGPFISVDELVEVKGIGVSIVDRNRDKVSID